MRSLLAGSRAVEAIRLELKAELEGDRSWAAADHCGGMRGGDMPLGPVLPR
jgi:hypothetical protein